MARARGSLRFFPLDGALLCFDRATGENRLFRGPETAHLRQRAPRVLQVSITNACNKSCSFCYRPHEEKSEWTFDGLVELARFADRWGVLELAFGGGEPTMFPRLGELLRTVWKTTRLATHFTTNGSRLTPELLREIDGAYGQIQLSIYDEDEPHGAIETLVRAGARFGLNYLVTPARLGTLEADVAAFAARGVRDVLFLSYKGPDAALHLSADEARRFDEAVARLHRVLGQRLDLKVDVCWSDRLRLTPRLFEEGDCGAGSVFLSLGADRKVVGCSFADGGAPVRSLEDLPALWAKLRVARAAAAKAGCARRVPLAPADSPPVPLRLSRSL